MKKQFELIRKLEGIDSKWSCFVPAISTKLYNNSLAYLIKVIVYSLFYQIKFHKQNDSNGDLLYLTTDIKNRKNIDDINQFYSRNSFSYMSVSSRFTLLRFFKIILNVMIIFTFIRFRFKFPFRFSIVASFLLAKSQNDYLLISSNQYITSHSGLITQCDINEYEALVTLYFNNEKRTTVTNQHGQYRFLNDKNLSQDIEQITSLRSRYLLAWGNQTVNECNKYERFHGECINFGSLIASYTKKSENNSGIFGVILNGSNLREANFALIRMASELSFVSGLKYVIRLHPADDYNYSSLLNSGCISVKVYNDECYFELVDFSMSHSSGLFITNLPSNNKILLYKDELLPEVYRSSELCFSNISELNTILSNYESFHQTEVTKFVCKYNEERMLGHISDLFIKS